MGEGNDELLKKAIILFLINKCKLRHRYAFANEVSGKAYLCIVLYNIHN